MSWKQVRAGAVRACCSQVLQRMVPVALVVGTGAGNVWGQSNASAPRPFVEEQRQLERERALRQQQGPEVDERLQGRPGPDAAAKLPPGESPCFRIDRLTLDGEQSARFQWLLEEAGGRAAGLADGPIGRCLGTQGINTVLARLQQALVARGWITTRVLAAPQDLSGGSLAISLVPGRVAAIRFADPAAATTSLRGAIPIRPGDLLNLRDIEQGLENLKRLPTVEADIQIEPAAGPGARPGESDLVVKYSRQFPLRTTLSLDDSGTEATGKTQAGATVAWDGPLGLNDLAYLSLNHDAFNHSGQGTRGYTAHYSVPYGDWPLSATGSAGDYHQTVAGLDQDYVYSGQTSNLELRASRVLYRDASRKTSASLRAFQRSSSNDINDVEVEVQLGESDSVKNLAAAIVAGGALAGMGFQPFPNQPNVGSGAQQFGQQLINNLQIQGTSTLINTAIKGGSFEEGLKDVLLAALVNSIAATTAKGIGDLSNGPDAALNDFTNKVAHAIAGCALGAAHAGDLSGCGGGAIGAAVGDLTAQLMDLSPDMTALYSDQDKIYLAGLVSGLVAALSGGDQKQIDTANWAGANSAGSNELLHSGARVAALTRSGYTLEDIPLPGLGDSYADPRMASALKKWIELSSAEGVNIKFNSAFRLSGHVVNGAVYTPAGDSSLHNAGLAVDIRYDKLVDIPGGLTADQQRQILRRTASLSGLAWGGNFSKPDNVHFFIDPYGKPGPGRSSLIQTQQDAHGFLTGR